MVSNTIKAEKTEGSKFESIMSIKGENDVSSKHSDYIIDESKLAGGSAQWLFFPQNEADIITIVNKMREDNTPITISGGRTGIVGSAVPFGGAVVSFDHMNNIIGLDYDEDKKKYFLRMDPGIALDTLDEIIRNKELTNKNNLSQTADYVTKFKQEQDTYMFPVDPTEMTAMVGGSIAANASGARSFKYGAMRPWVRRLRVILDTGEVLDITRGQVKENDGIFIIKKENQEVEVKIPTYQMPKAKNAAGLWAEKDMDLIDLFIGSEGIFGIITEVDLWITKRPLGLPNVMFFPSEKDAINFVTLLRDDKELGVEYMEFFDEHSFELLKSKQDTNPALANLATIPDNMNIAIFFEVPYSEDLLEDIILKLEDMAVECNTSIDYCWSGFDEVEKENFRLMRHAVPEIVNSIIGRRKHEYPKLHKLGTDMSVSDKHLKDMMKIYHETLEEAGLEYVIWGHIADNHVHVNILPRNMDELEQGKKIYKKFASKAIEFEGSVSAEHGIGKMKHEYLQIMYGEERIAQMRSVKLKLDPQGLFNRDNIFPWV
ncbi:MAG: FAD-binding oxidoreductase [Candidatus Heimdallarchaeaceae archaeon]|jgi:D-lactate dehydrogenase (cytochrome)